MCCVRAIRDTIVADHCAPGLNTTHRVDYHPPIAVSLVLLTQSVSYFKWILWRCAIQWPYVGMSSLVTPLNHSCYVMGDIGKISPRIPSTSAQNSILSVLVIHIIPRRQIYVTIDNPSLIPSISRVTTSSYLWKYVGAAKAVSHPHTLQSNGCRCFPN